MLKLLMGTSFTLSIIRSLLVLAAPTTAILVFSSHWLSLIKEEVAASVHNAMLLPVVYPALTGAAVVGVILFPLILRLRREGYSTGFVLQELWHLIVMGFLYLLGIWLFTRGIYYI